jgi:hypothetical protein
MADRMPKQKAMRDSNNMSTMMDIAAGSMKMKMLASKDICTCGSDGKLHGEGCQVQGVSCRVVRDILGEMMCDCGSDHLYTGLGCPNDLIGTPCYIGGATTRTLTNPRVHTKCRPGFVLTPGGVCISKDKPDFDEGALSQLMGNV